MVVPVLGRGTSVSIFFRCFLVPPARHCTAVCAVGFHFFFRVNEAWHFPRLTHDDHHCFTLCLKKKKKTLSMTRVVVNGKNQPFV